MGSTTKARLESLATCRLESRRYDIAPTFLSAGGTLSSVAVFPSGFWWYFLATRTATIALQERSAEFIPQLCRNAPAAE